MRGCDGGSVWPRDCGVSDAVRSRERVRAQTNQRVAENGFLRDLYGNFYPLLFWKKGAVAIDSFCLVRLHRFIGTIGIVNDVQPTLNHHIIL